MCLTQTLFVRHAGRHDKNAQAEIKQGRFLLQTHIKEGKILEGIKAGGRTLVFSDLWKACCFKLLQSKCGGGSGVEYLGGWG